MLNVKTKTRVKAEFKVRVQTGKSEIEFLTIHVLAALDVADTAGG